MNNTFIIKRPIVTEKTLLLADKENTYVFEVAANAEKNQIKKMVTELFKVEAESVNTVLGYRGSKKTGRKRLAVTGARHKKALVKLKPGQKIELFDLEEGTAE